MTHIRVALDGVGRVSMLGIVILWFWVDTSYLSTWTLGFLPIRCHVVSSPLYDLGYGVTPSKAQDTIPRKIEETVQNAAMHVVVV